MDMPGDKNERVIDEPLSTCSEQRRTASGISLRPLKLSCNREKDCDERLDEISDIARSPSPFQPDEKGCGSDTESDMSTFEFSDCSDVSAERKRKRRNKRSRVSPRKRQRTSSSWDDFSYASCNPPAHTSARTAPSLAKVRPSGLSLSGDGTISSLNGRRCPHAVGDGNSSSHNTCLILEHFGLLHEIIGDQRAVVCEEHCGVIPMDGLLQHLTKKHGSQCRSLLGKSLGKGGKRCHLLSPVVNHISDALSIDLKQSLSDILGLELAQPIGHGFPAPERSVQCPYCSAWFICCKPGSKKPQFKNLHDHIHHSTRESCKAAWDAAPLGAENDFVVRYAQPLFLATQGRNKSPKVPLQSHWTPDSAPQVETESNQQRNAHPSSDEYPSLCDNPVAQWLNAIGWPEWLQSCRTVNEQEVELDARDILRYIALPHRRVPTSLPETEQSIENGLHLVYKLSRNYLIDANAFVGSQHIQVRHSITEGCVDLSGNIDLRFAHLLSDLVLPIGICKIRLLMNTGGLYTG
jgi:hypothetical protein